MDCRSELALLGGAGGFLEFLRSQEHAEKIVVLLMGNARFSSLSVNSRRYLLECKPQALASAHHWLHKSESVHFHTPPVRFLSHQE